MPQVRKIVAEMILKGVVKVVKEKPHCVSPLGLVTKDLPDGSKKYRLVWDASRHVNTFVEVPHVRLAHLEKALEISEKDEQQIIFDLASAYYHIKIEESQHKYLGASIVNSDGSILYFEYTHLPFGLNSAVHSITKIWKPLSRFLNKEGYKNTIYIDDGRILVKDPQKVEEARIFVYNTIAAAGWAVEKEKSDMKGQASTRKKYLGFIIDTAEMKVFATDEKLSKIEQKIEKALVSDLIKVKDLASLLGLIVSLEYSHDYLARIATRSGYAILSEHTDAFGWKGILRINPETKEELNFFRKYMYTCNGSLIKTAQTDVKIESILENPVAKNTNLKNHEKCSNIFVSDASDQKAVAYNLTDNSIMELSYNFTEEEKIWSSSAREALAVLRTLQQFEYKKQKRKNIYWVTDSEVMAQVLKKGSHRPMLQKIVFNIAKLCHQLEIRIEPVHLRREDPRIQIADNESKIKDTDNWSIDECSYQMLNNHFHFDWDVFADKQNRRTQKFFSKYYDVESAGIDAYAQNWNELGTLWICPPVTELVRIHQRLVKSTAKGVVILPKWETSSFINFFLDGKGGINHPYTLAMEWHPYIVQNEGASNTALFGITRFPFLALAFNY